MTVTFVYDPNGDPTIQKLVMSLNQPDRGVIAFAAQPGKSRDLWLFETALDALGKTSDDRSVITRARSDAGMYTAAWLCAHDIDHLILYDIANTNARDLNTLCVLATSCGVDVTLFGYGTINSSLRTEIDRWADQLGDIDHLRNLTRAKPSNPQTTPTVPPCGTVAETDFATFLPDTRRTLDHHQFRHVNAVYERCRQDFTTLDFTDEQTVAERLGTHLVATTDPNQQTVIIRALQAAALPAGFHIDVDVPGVLATASATAAVQALTDDDWTIICSTSRPRQSAIVAVYASGIPEPDVDTVPRSAVADDATVIHHNGIDHPIPVLARPSIRAQLFVHRSMGLSAEAPFLNDSGAHETRDTRDRLNRLASRLGVNLRIKHSRADSPRWQYRHGITITDLRDAA